jgi:SAM-dependent methyltransferase
MNEQVVPDQRDSVNKAFSKQALYYDANDQSNCVLTDLRQQVYEHVQKFIKPESHILELNAGTGIDALHFVELGHRVHATDLSEGMIKQIQKKIQENRWEEKLTYQKLSYDQLDLVSGKFDYVFSNFGGLNCIQDLGLVTRSLPGLLNKGAYLTWVVMPPVCPWELAGVFKGRISKSFRRCNSNGVTSHLEGHYFKTYYHSLNAIRKTLEPSFQFIKSEALAVISPPPHRGDIPEKHGQLYRVLRRLDQTVRHIFPFNRWGDHVILTFRFSG